MQNPGWECESLATSCCDCSQTNQNISEQSKWWICSIMQHRTSRVTCTCSHRGYPLGSARISRIGPSQARILSFSAESSSGLVTWLVSSFVPLSALMQAPPHCRKRSGEMQRNATTDAKIQMISACFLLTFEVSQIWKATDIIITSCSAPEQPLLGEHHRWLQPPGH